MSLVLTLFIGGCATTDLNNAFHKDDFPTQQYYVGGAFSKGRYNTQESGGTLILADRVSRKILLTKSMTPNDEFLFPPYPTRNSFLDHLKAAGIDPSTMDLSLYFIPLENTAEDNKK